MAPAVRDVKANAFRTRAVMMEIPQRALGFYGTADYSYLSSSKSDFHMARGFIMQNLASYYEFKKKKVCQCSLVLSNIYFLLHLGLILNYLSMKLFHIIFLKDALKKHHSSGKSRRLEIDVGASGLMRLAFYLPNVLCYQVVYLY